MGPASTASSGFQPLGECRESQSHPNTIFLLFVFNGLRWGESESRIPPRYREGGKREFGPASLPAILNIPSLVPTRSARASFTHSGFPQPHSPEARARLLPASTLRILQLRLAGLGLLPLGLADDEGAATLVFRLVELVVGQKDSPRGDLDLLSYCSATPEGMRFAAGPAWGVPRLRAGGSPPPHVF